MTDDIQRFVTFFTRGYTPATVGPIGGINTSIATGVLGIHDIAPLSELSTQLNLLFNTQHGFGALLPTGFVGLHNTIYTGTPGVYGGTMAPQQCVTPYFPRWL